MSDEKPGCISPECFQLAAGKVPKTPNPWPKRPDYLLDQLLYASELEVMAETFPRGALPTALRREAFRVAQDVFNQLRVPRLLASREL
ncbi:MAG: hypothetical protein ACT4QA_04440 [Panacagrimonas sp.]